MIVIAGKYKGCKLVVPETKLRPTLSIVRESIFNILQNSFEKAYCLDMFAGSGSLGIEALSRGASRVDFVECSKKACDAIKQNLFKVKEKQNVITMDFRQFVRRWKAEYDIIFASPPYYLKMEDEILHGIRKYKKLKTDGILMLQIFKKVDPDFELYNYDVVKKRLFGITQLCFAKQKKVQQQIKW